VRACVFKAPGAPLEITEVADPDPGPGEVVVRVRDCGICGSDFHAAGINADVSLPPGTILGHEFAGVVERTGAEVGTLVPGDPVAGMSYLPCGECEWCRIGHAARCSATRLIGFGDVPGAYAERIKVRPGSLFKIPADMSLRVGATVEPLVVGLHGIHRARFQAGETCLVMGAGTIGLMTLLWLRFAGARAIVVSEPNPKRREVALEIGADAAVDPRIQNPATAMTKLSGSGPDIVFECIGEPGTLAQAIGYAPRGGRVCVLGFSMRDDGFPPGLAMAKELDVNFSLGIEPGEVETAISALASGRISTEPLITHVVGLEDLPRAFAALPEATNQVKVMIEFPL
jgi:(R,R)-butanediol dehydrogenase/meso-butanediol dehydrogenase/diacetyl reductase